MDFYTLSVIGFAILMGCSTLGLIIGFVRLIMRLETIGEDCTCSNKMLSSKLKEMNQSIQEMSQNTQQTLNHIQLQAISAEGCGDDSSRQRSNSSRPSRSSKGCGSSKECGSNQKCGCGDGCRCGEGCRCNQGCKCEAKKSKENQYDMIHHSHEEQLFSTLIKKLGEVNVNNMEEGYETLTSDIERIISALKNIRTHDRLECLCHLRGKVPPELLVNVMHHMDCCGSNNSIGLRRRNNGNHSEDRDVRSPVIKEKSSGCSHSNDSNDNAKPEKKELVAKGKEELVEKK